ncbi:MAG: aconitase X catalytic domain-containing protein [Rhodospirillaceae bacterium]|nr:aconitase X catalytic domain-containing protein [Rhodospirillaceae bacterium]
MPAMDLSPDERRIADGADGAAKAMAMRLVSETGRLLGAQRLLPIVSSHVDGCLYHGDSGTYFAERLASDGGQVAVPTTLNVGALDLLHPDRVKGDAHHREMSLRMMRAYEMLGCRPTWTCAPYQAGHRPAVGTDVAWGESNAVAFCNSVLGARTNRYGDFLDIACALVGRAPDYGLHRAENRRATVVVDASGLSPALRNADVFYPVLGTWLGAEIGAEIAAIDGLPPKQGEDRLKALGAAAASAGAVGLFHVVGSTPEAPTLTAATQAGPTRAIRLTPEMVRTARDRLSTARDGAIDCVALGSPHFSEAEFAALKRLASGRRFRVPLYVCTRRDLVEREDLSGLEAAGALIVADTCVVVTPILPAGAGTLMTNSGKFAHYGPANLGYDVVYGSLEDCVASAVEGRVVRDESVWR